MPIRAFQDAVALITGGASGIGRALAQDLARRGASVVLADLQTELAEQTASDIRASGGDASAVTLDVRDAGAFERVVDQVWRDHERIDYFFNNAGTGSIGEVLTLTAEDWDLVLGVNLHGVLNGIRAVYPRMAKQGFGHIINTASMAGLGPTPLLVPYATTKHAVVGLSKSLRPEAELHGVRVSVLCPGVVRTPLLTGGAFMRKPKGWREDRAMPLWEKLRPIEPEPFARDVLRAVAKNRGVIVLPWHAAFLTRLLAAFPGLQETIARAMLRRINREMPELSSGE
jgi:NAD(P)-dependent dehydrogenase (short-subunit alcohol dehydrogenase family)